MPCGYRDQKRPTGPHCCCAIPEKSKQRCLSAAENVCDDAVEVVVGVAVVIGVDTIGGAIAAGWLMGVPMGMPVKFCMAADKFCT